MIYWVTNSITTSVRLYSETFNKKEFQTAIEWVQEDYYYDGFWLLDTLIKNRVCFLFDSRAVVHVPTACALFAHEIAYQPPNFLTDKYPNLIQHQHYDDGGHFAAFEVPDVLANDVYLAVSKFENLKK